MEILKLTLAVQEVLETDPNQMKKNYNVWRVDLSLIVVILSSQVSFVLLPLILICSVFARQYFPHC